MPRLVVLPIAEKRMESGMTAEALLEFIAGAAAFAAVVYMLRHPRELNHLPQTRLFLLILLGICVVNHLAEGIESTTFVPIVYIDAIDDYFNILLPPLWGLLIYGCIHDLTSIGVARRESYFRTLISSAPVGIRELDTDGTIVFSNDADRAMFGFSNDELTGQPFVAYFDSNQIWKNIAKSGDTPVQLTARHRCADGEQLDISIDWTYRLDNDGEVTGYRLFMIDITLTKKSEEALLSSNSRLEGAVTELKDTQDQLVAQERLGALGEMSRGIAHDINNLLTPILGYADLMVRAADTDAGNAQCLRHAKRIQQSAGDAAEVITRLRSFYAPNHTNELTPVCLRDIVQEAVALTEPARRAQAQQEGRRITVDTEQLENSTVIGDPAELRQVATSLICNAIEAMPDGGAISFKTCRTDTRICLVVQDTGIGMDTETKRRCMEPFFTTKGLHGSGLGLSSVYGAVKRLDGEISIDSCLGKGTTVRMMFDPCDEPVATPDVAVVKSGPLRVLLIDDEPPVREVIRELLKCDGHHVDTANGGIDGTQQFHPDHYDIVITDRSMPDLPGDAVAISVKAMSPRTPVIMLTGFGALMSDEKSPPGVDLVLTKPIDYIVLQNALAKYGTAAIAV